METLFFWIFAALAVVGAIGTVWMRYVVHSAFALMGTLFGIAGLFVLLGADFLAVSQVLIYVGGILVLILFGIMLTPPDRSERSAKRVVWLTASVLAIVGALAAQIGSAVRWFERPLAPPQPTAAPIGRELLDPEGSLVLFELISVVLLVALVGAVFIARRRKVVPVAERLRAEAAEAAR